MRTKNSIINSIAGAVSYLILVLSNFIVRSVFVQQMGADVQGVSDLFTNIISMLALAELGLGTGLIYKLYKPVADHDVPRIKSLLRFYKRAYLIIGSVILAGGLILSFYVYVFDKYKVFSHFYLGITFFLFVLDVIASYLFAHQKALITADQKNYIINIVHAAEQVVVCIFQVVLLVWTRSFVLFILVRIFCRVAEGFVLFRWYKKLYPDIDVKDSEAIDREERRDLFRNINAMLYHRIGGFSLTSTSNMILSYFESFGLVCLYNNYSLITSNVNNMIAQIFQGVTASFGDLLNTEDRQKAYERFNALYYVNYLVAAFCSIAILVMIEPFIRLWLGEKFLLSRWTLLLIIVYFYVYGMRRVIFMARDSAGLYTPDKYMPLVETCLNIGLGIWFVQIWSVNGILLANIVSMLVIPFWIQPFIVYKYLFGRSVKEYFKRYAMYTAALGLSGGVTVWICSKIWFGNMFLVLLLRGCVCLLVPNGINLLLFCWTKEFRYVINIFPSIKKRFLKKSK